MRLNIAAIATIWRLRRAGNSKAYVALNIRAFVRGYSLFAPMVGNSRRRWWIVLWGAPRPRLAEPKMLDDVDVVALEIVRAGWRTMDSAPRDRRILILSLSGEMYVAHWGVNPWTDDEAWLISPAGEDQHLIVGPTHWRPLPAPP